ncbi:hypothetical protein BBK82_29445 [Lentzea guizhouensis]|uniref:Uncharacterized protein n=1 Tax=Lentzea guizhouensis TaxID=1586287 RepID=A0A1B2HP89_9PSEU|nr:hypothetical protein BBK82_29445 [Lentzea guizhouensis]
MRWRQTPEAPQLQGAASSVVFGGRVVVVPSGNLAWTVPVGSVSRVGTVPASSSLVARLSRPRLARAARASGVRASRSGLVT